MPEKGLPSTFEIGHQGEREREREAVLVCAAAAVLFYEEKLNNR